MLWKTFSQLTMVEQSLFGLPWAFAAALIPFIDETLVCRNRPMLWLVMIAGFIAARTAGMSFNRLIDKEIDAANPRAKDRALPRGEISVAQVKMLAWLNVAAFVVCCGFMNALCLGLAPLAVCLLWAYSYTKRFTALCHLVLGCVHGFCVIFAWAAITGTVTIATFFLAAAAMASIAGMDIIYALLDWNFDKHAGLHSIPVFLGLKRSVLVARTLHLLAIVCLIKVAMIVHAGLLFYLGIGVISATYAMYHRRLDIDHMTNVNKTFFYCNTVVGVMLLISTVGALIWKTLS